LRVTTKKGLLLRKKVHPGDRAGGCSDLEMTWLLYCAGAATDPLIMTCVLDRTYTTQNVIEQGHS